MGERWAYLLVVVLILSALPVLAHKSPVVEYTYVGHIWEEAYTSIPRQPVIDEYVVLKAHVHHPNETIEGEVASTFAVYQDDTVYTWSKGKSYKRPDWLLIKEAEGTPTEQHNEFTMDVIIDRPGSYLVTVDWTQDGQYIGQSMHMLDVEPRMLSPMYLAFLALVTFAILLGVRRGIL